MNSTQFKQDSERFQKVFFAENLDRIDSVKKGGGRFVHYTTADVLVSILRTKQVWMRNTSTMNDYSEVYHGYNCLSAALKDPKVGEKFKESLNGCFPGIFDEIIKLFDGWWPEINRGTFITCLSEHHAHEDDNGRLSMWRAYGKQNGVALVLNGEVIFSESDVLKIYSSPVSYYRSSELAKHLDGVASRIAENASFIQTLGHARMTNALFHFFVFSVLCTKHPGFSEEREWRVISCPKMWQSTHVKESIEVVRGVPQLVQKIPLADIPSEGLTGLEISKLLDRVIIGPCESPFVIQRALVELLKSAGVPHAHQKVVVSDIPLR